MLLVRGEVDNSRGESKVLVKSLDDKPTVYRPEASRSARVREIASPDGDQFGANRPQPSPPPPPPPPPSDEWDLPLDSLAPTAETLFGGDAPQQDGLAQGTMRSGQYVVVVLNSNRLERLKLLMRQVVEILDRQDGNDRFGIQVEGLDFALEFPNSTTSWSPQLQQQVTGLRGVSDVRVH